MRGLGLIYDVHCTPTELANKWLVAVYKLLAPLESEKHRLFSLSLT